jgi:hypothetical protein
VTPRSPDSTAGESSAPRSTLRFFLQLLAGIAAIAAGVTAIAFVVAGGERAAVKKYVGFLRDAEISQAYLMLAAGRKAEISPDAFTQKLHTPLLVKSTGLTITASGRNIAGKDCVTVAVDHQDAPQTVYFYVIDEDGKKRIHSVFTNEDFATSSLAAIEPWHCD